MLLEWNTAALAAFVAAANDETSDMALPQWFPHQRTRGSITVETVIEDLFAQLACFASGNCHSVCLAPVSVAQFGHMMSRLGEIEHEPFVQHCLRNVPASTVLLRVTTLSEPDSAVNGSSLSRPPPANSVRQLFS